MDDKYLKEIESCVEKSMEAEEFSKMKIDFTRKNTTEQGILADLIFATVSGTDRDNKYKEVNLALKLGKRNEALREGAPVLIECYKRELFFYDTVLPAFHRFQVERNISNIFDALPKCYGTVLSDDIEALVLEDLKRKAFVLHDQQIGMNLQHLQLVLKNYAKFHALSFAFRVQHHQKFNKLAANYHSVLKKLFLMWIGGPQDEKVRMVLREAGREDLNEKYTEETKNNELTTLLAILDDVPQESVITHGDCHNDNLLFEYKGNDKENLLGVAIIDWQLSEIHSPVLDLSYFLYSTASKEELVHIDDLLKFYHSHLTDFMKQLGSDTQKIFPYSTLVDHWRRYSIYGLIFTRNVLHRFYIPIMPVITGNKESDALLWKNVKFENGDQYSERLISVLDHYFNSKLT